MFLDILLTKYRWLITNVPQVLHSHYNWKLWFDGLTSINIADLRMNISGIMHSRYMIEDEFDNHEPGSEEFDCLIDIHNRLIELLLLL